MRVSDKLAQVAGAFLPASSVEDKGLISEQKHNLAAKAVATGIERRAFHYDVTGGKSIDIKPNDNGGALIKASNLGKNGGGWMMKLTSEEYHRFLLLNKEQKREFVKDFIVRNNPEIARDLFGKGIKATGASLLPDIRSKNKIEGSKDISKEDVQSFMEGLFNEHYNKSDNKNINPGLKL